MTPPVTEIGIALTQQDPNRFPPDGCAGSAVGRENLYRAAAGEAYR